MAASIEVVLTGTGTPVPVPERAGAGTLVRTSDATIQVDAGRSTVLRLIEAGVTADRVDALLLTHHHSDHTTDTPDLVVSAWLMSAPDPMTIVAPTGLTAEYAARALDALAGDMEFRRGHRGVADIARPIVHAFDPEQQPITVWERGSTRVDAVRVRHEPVEHAVGYRVGTELGSVVVSGDTRACDEIERLAEGARVLVHEVVDPERVPPSRQHTIGYHAVPREVGALARRSGVEVLLLTHLWPAPTSEADTRALLDGVRAGGFAGDVVVGCDLTRAVVTADGIAIDSPVRAIPALHAPRLSAAAVIP